MKNIFTLLLFFLVIGNDSAMAQQAKDTYKFPVQPGSERWKQFKTTDEMLIATQLPAQALKQISTAGLVETCLDYPLLCNIIAYDNLQTGLQKVSENFNGLQELLSRPDAKYELIQAYQQLNPEEVDRQVSLEKKGKIVFRLTYIELLLAHPAIVTHLTTSERKALSQIALAKFKAKDSRFDTFGGFGELSTALVLGRILEKENFSSTYVASKRRNVMANFLATGVAQETQLINQIVADAQVFAK